MADKSSAWIKQPQQERSRRTLARLLDAAEQMLNEGSFDQATIPLLVARAESSVGSFYSLFGSKDSLFECLIDRHEERTLQLVRDFCREDRWQGAGLAEKLEAWVEVVVGFCCSERGLMRARLLRNVNDPRSIPEHRRRTVRSIFEHLTRFFEPNHHEVDHPQPPEAVSFALMCVDYVAAYRILIEDPGGRYFSPLENAELERELGRMALAYLGLHRAAPHHPERDSQERAR